MSLDGSGLQTDGSDLNDIYFRTLTLRPLSGTPGLSDPTATINQHAVYDSARRMSQYVRMLNRAQIVGYEVVDGKSILYFKRHRTISAVDVDLFAGVADEIVHTAPDGGITNEWLLDIDLLPYHSSESSVFKPSAFADWYARFDRCGFYSEKLANNANATALWHVAYGAKVAGNMGSEMPPGFRYMWLPNGQYLNDSQYGTPDEFYKSCQIYKPPYMIESAETIEESGVEIVKVTLTGRLQNTVGETGGAPSSVDRDVTGWVAATIQAEPYRTDENGLRLYLIWVYDETNTTTRIHGDTAADADAGLGSYASIFPRFCFTKLVPNVRQDNNRKHGSNDTPLWHDLFSQMALYLRAMCEGWIDEIGSIDNLCQFMADNGGAFFPSDWSSSDYTFENLCFDAFGGRWLGMLPTEETYHFDAENIREDFPNGAGPLPNTDASAEVFNRYSAAINKLTKLRVMLPLAVECKQRWYSDTQLIAGDPGIKEWYGTPPGATTLELEDDEFGVCESGTVWFAESYVASCFGDYTGGNWPLKTDRITTEYRVVGLSEAMLEAVPVAWRDQIGTRTGRLALQQITRSKTLLTGNSGSLCTQTDFVGKYEAQVVSDVVTCDSGDETTYEVVFAMSGVLDPGATPGEGWVLWGADCAGCETDGLAAPHQVARDLFFIEGNTFYVDLPVVDVIRPS